VECAVNKDYEFNQRFRILVGGAYLSETGLRFPRRPQKDDGSYKTIFGPTFYHKGVIYARNNVNIEKAAQRQLGAREPGRPGFHRLLENNQRARVNTLPFLVDIITKINHHFKEVQLTRQTLYEEIVRYVNESKTNKKLRQKAIQHLDDNGQIYHNLYSKLAEGKVKPEEWGRWGKYPRLFLNLGYKSSLVAGFILSALKHCFLHNTMESEFVDSPDPKRLKSVFHRLIDVKTLYFAFFSDDSSVAIKCIDGTFRANVDIAGCDASHTEVIFNILRQIARNTIFESQIAKAIGQCTLPLFLSSYGKFIVDFVILRPRMPVLYTGSVLTTVINNIANMLIFLSIRSYVMRGDVIRPNLRVSDCAEIVRLAAEDVGYIVTVDECRKIEELQFLKHSPCMSNAGWTPVLNVGVILRLMGSCFGDLPGTKNETLEQRAYAWNYQVVKSLVHAGDYQFTRTLRERFSVDPVVSQRTLQVAKRRIEKMDLYKTRSAVDDVYDASVMARYNLNASDMDELCNCLKGDFFGITIDCHASRVILMKDYGL
jgi:hypothetical protein